METRIERIAGTDRKITHADIMRLGENEDYQALKAVMPKIFFDQLSQGKWFGIGNRSFLAVNGYIDKINSLEGSYRSGKEEIRTQTRHSLQEQQAPQRESSTTRESPESEKKGFYRTLQFQKPYLRGEDVVLLQERLHVHGCLPGKIDGVFGKNTLNAFLKFQKILGKPQDGIFHVNSEEMRILLSNKPVVSTKNQGEPQEPHKSGENPEVKEEIKTTETLHGTSSVSTNINTALSEVGIQNEQERIKGSLVSISTGWGKLGSGAFIGPNLVVTAEHVLRNLDTGNMSHVWKIKGADGKMYHPVNTFYDPSNNDIAYIQTRETNSNYLEFAPDSSRVRTEGILLGFSGSKPRFYAPGMTPETQRTKKLLYDKVHSSMFGKTMFVDFRVNKGDSGGPIVDRDGKLLGIVTRSYEYGNHGESGGVAEPVEDIRDSIRGA